MLLKRIVPCLDVKDGQVVKGVRFQGLRSVGDPADCARRYEEQGADELVLLDVAATPRGRDHALETVRAVRRELAIPLTVGGGVRSADDARALLNAGADKVALNSAAVQRPELLSELSAEYGAQCVVLSIDARRDEDGRARVLVRSGTRKVALDALDWAREGERLGAGEILLTSWDRDGTREGYELTLLSQVCAAVRVPVIASGGAAAPNDLGAAFEAGASAALAASLFHDGDWTVAQVKSRLAESGHAVRL